MSTEGLFRESELGRQADVLFRNDGFQTAYDTLENRVLERAINAQDTDELKKIQLLRELKQELYALISQGTYADHKLEEIKDAVQQGKKEA